MKAKTRQEIAAIYGVDRKTLNRWLNNRQIILPAGLVSPKDQLRIFREFGFPPGFDPLGKKVNEDTQE